MARMSRLVVPGYPHHVTQRGNRRMKTFFSERDYQAYIDFLLKGLKLSGTEVWAYCLMPNHVHFIVVPNSEDSLSILFRHVHRHYSRMINFREKWKGHLWQGNPLENPGKMPLEMIEVQTGSYLGEDDIVRFEDRYGRS